MRELRLPMPACLWSQNLRQFAFKHHNRCALLGEPRLGTCQPLGDSRLLALQLLAAQIELLQTSLELLAAASQRGLALVAYRQLTLDCFGARVQRAALGVECT